MDDAGNSATNRSRTLHLSKEAQKRNSFVGWFEYRTRAEQDAEPLLVEEALTADGAAKARNTVFAANFTLELVVISEFFVWKLVSTSIANK